MLVGAFFSLVLSCFTPSYFIFYEILSPYREIAFSISVLAEFEVCMRVCVYGWFVFIRVRVEYVYVLVSTALEISWK